MARYLLVVLHAQPLGGLEIYGRDIADSLRRLKHEVSVMSVMERPHELPDWNGIPIQALAPHNPFLFRLYVRTWRRQLARELRRHGQQYDHVLVMHPYAAISAHRASLRNYWTWAYGIEVWGNWPDWLHEGLIHSQKIVAISRYTAQSVTHRLPTHQVTIVSPVVDVNRFIPSPHPYMLKPPFRLLTVGRLSAGEQYKGHDSVIRVLSAIQERIGTKVEYWIVGHGDDRPRLEHAAQDAGVSESVNFCGRVSEKDLLIAYQECDIFVMPSVVTQKADETWTGEGFGIVYLEASACGKPVIGSNVGGTVDAIDDSVTGLCIDPTSDSALIEAVVKLLSNPPLMQSMGQAGRRRTETQFSLTALDRNVKNLLESV